MRERERKKEREREREKDIFLLLLLDNYLFFFSLLCVNTEKEATARY